MKAAMEALSGFGITAADGVLILGLFILIYSALAFIPAGAVYYYMNKKNDRFDGNFAYTYTGAWGGGFLFMILFIIWIDFFFPIWAVLGFITTFSLWIAIGWTAGSFMGYTFLAKLKTEDDEAEAPMPGKKPAAKKKPTTMKKKTTKKKPPKDS